MKKKLLGMSLQELQIMVQEFSLPRFSATQIADWLYKKRVDSIEKMTNLSKAAREKLSESWEVGWTMPAGSFRSKDGTVKYLFEVECPVMSASLPGAGQMAAGAAQSSVIEAVVIPDEDRRTLCISSQAGCKMGCKFCMTGRGGWHGNLDRSQILSQILSIPEGAELTNVVFMGMGEPLDNYETLSAVLDVMTSEWGFSWSPKRITVSSIGVLPMLKRLLDEHRCHIAISLHNPFPDERLQLMPVQAAYPIQDVVALLKQYDFSGQRRISFEYTMFAGFNDDRRHADALCRILRGLECRVNMIRFHKIPDFPYETSTPEVMNAFRDRLNAGGVTATIRASRGEDIMAACGLLAGKHSAARDGK